LIVFDFSLFALVNLEGLIESGFQVRRGGRAID